MENIHSHNFNTNTNSDSNYNNSIDNINSQSEVNEHNEHEHFYHNETVDVFDSERRISSEAIITSIRGDIFVIKYSNTNEEEVIRHNRKILISQCI